MRCQPGQAEIFEDVSHTALRVVNSSVILVKRKLNILIIMYLNYKLMYEMNSAWFITVNAIAICLYFGTLIFAAVNMIKFRKHRTYATGLFYCTACLSLLVRMAYYIF